VKLQSVRRLIVGNPALKKLKDILSVYVPIEIWSNLSKKFQTPYSKLDIEYGIIFVHVPKTAGSAILKQLFNEGHHGHFDLSLYHSYDKILFDKSKKIAVIRNPWDRFVSAYHYLAQNVGQGKNATRFKNELLKDINCFDDFVFKMMGDKGYEARVLSWDHFRPQWDYVAIDGKYCIDLLGRFENLTSFTNEFCEMLNVEGQSISKSNSSVRNEYHSYYTEKTKKYVEGLYQTEINYFEYSF